MSHGRVELGTLSSSVGCRASLTSSLCVLPKSKTIPNDTQTYAV